MGFGNFINNKSQLLIIIQSTVQKEFFLLHLLLLSLVFVFVFMLEMFINSLISTERHFQRSFVLAKMRNGSQEIVFFSSIDISLPFSFLFDPERIHVARTIVDGKFMFDLFRQFSLDDILRAQLFSLAFCEFRWSGLIFAVHVILSGSFTLLAVKSTTLRLVCLTVISQRSHELLVLVHPLRRLYA